jgi:hypothetical protein
MMPAARIPQDLDYLRSDIAVLTRVVADNTQAQLANLKQWWTLEALKERWALGRDNVIALLRERGAYEPRAGHPIRVHLKTVLELDAYLEGNPRSLAPLMIDDSKPGDARPLPPVVLGDEG